MTFTIEYSQGNVIDGSGRRYPDAWVAGMEDGTEKRFPVICGQEEDDFEASRRVHQDLISWAVGYNNG